MEGGALHKRDGIEKREGKDAGEEERGGPAKKGYVFYKGIGKRPAV